MPAAHIGSAGPDLARWRGLQATYSARLKGKGRQPYPHPATAASMGLPPPPPCGYAAAAWPMRPPRSAASGRRRLRPWRRRHLLRCGQALRPRAAAACTRPPPSQASLPSRPPVCAVACAVRRHEEPAPLATAERYLRRGRAPLPRTTEVSAVERRRASLVERRFSPSFRFSSCLEPPPLCAGCGPAAGLVRAA